MSIDLDDPIALMLVAAAALERSGAECAAYGGLVLGSHSQFASVFTSIARLTHLFTRSPRPRLRSPHVNRMLTAPIHTVADATIEVTPCQSGARRTFSHGRRAHD